MVNLSDLRAARSLKAIALFVVVFDDFVTGTAGFVSTSLPPLRHQVAVHYQPHVPTRVTTRSVSISKVSYRQASQRWSAAVEVSSEAEQQDEGQSVSSATFSLIKACVGTGVLTLPWGLAAMGDVPKVLVPASLMMTVLGVISAYSFHLIGRICAVNDAIGLGDAWEKEVGSSSCWIVSASIFSCTFGTALTYSILLGDAFSSLAVTLGLKGWLASRQTSILAVTLTALYPLCSLSSLAALAPVSVVGVFGVLLTCIFMGIRSLPGGPYALPSGAFLGTLAPEMLPSFGKIGMKKAFSPSALILASMASISYLAHFNAGEFYHSLGTKNTMSKYDLVTALGFAGIAFINISILAFGFLTFGGNSSDIILNNYSTLDVGASICRLLMALSVIGSYPFMVKGMKNAFFRLFQKGKEVSRESTVKVTRWLLAILTGLALVVRDAGFVVSLNGAMMGSAITYIFPAVLYRRTTARCIKEGALKKTKRVVLERAISRALIGFGAVVAVVGAAVSILNSFFPQVL